MPTLPMTWLTPRITAVPVAKSRAAAIPSLQAIHRAPREAGIQARAVMPSTVSTVPAAIASVIRSPRKPIASAAAISGVVLVKVATTVAPAPLNASFAKYMDSAGCMMPVSANIQKPAVNQSPARIQNGAVTR